MPGTRREFLQTTASAASIIGLGGVARMAAAQTKVASKLAMTPSGRKSLLILGGTGFLGPHLVESALASGYEITLFNRGKSGPDMFLELETLIGDREKGEIDALKNRTWDVAIDTWSFGPNVIEDATAILKDNVEHYTFISTISVYSDNSIVNMDESGPLARIPEGETNIYQWQYYGPLKVLDEQAAETAFSGRTLVIRPGLIVGPRDRSDRFTYWPVRIERGGEVLAPGSPSDPVQIIDVRDLAEFTIHAIDARLTGPFNATGPVHPMTIAEMLHGCKAVTGGDATFTWVSAEFLEQEGVRAWMDLPVWVPPVGETAGFSTINCRKAIDAGMKTRPLAETVKDTLTWWKTLSENARNGLAPATQWDVREEGKSPRRAGLPASREREVLEKWRAR